METSAIPKVTYTTMSVAQADAFHAAFDKALVEIKPELGNPIPMVIKGASVWADSTTPDTSPNNRELVLGHAQNGSRQHATSAIEAARAAFSPWSAMPYQRRVQILRRAADEFRANRFRIGVLLSLEAGKNRLEAIGEVEEAADLISTYCDQIEEHDGYVIRLSQVDPAEVNHSVLRPYGVWAVIAPFNFPVALTTGMVAGALVAGNTVVLKPSHDTPYTGHIVYEMFAKAGLPDGVLNFVTGSASNVGMTLTSSSDVDGIVFTGSKEVGYQILSSTIRSYPRPCIAEMGGKNPVLVMESADLSKAIEGTVRAAFGYSGQKCSAASRAYVHRDVYTEFVEGLTSRTSELVVGDPTRRETFMGPVINAQAYAKFQSAAEEAHKSGQVRAGGAVETRDGLDSGFFVMPTVVDGLPNSHRFFSEELFLPFITVGSVDSLDEALRLANQSEFGLTAGIFTTSDQERAQFFDRMEAGVLYANRKGGATTGAWPGVQSFGGWKASGSSGKSALGPYYVQQFMREQNQTIVGD